ncbi:sister chromatid cohesion acetyltransferas-like protein Eco1 [Lindgomyces ingoldianus]|uniref:Sister chromatid cohesion acetyltransferas-like protein Eco1 n=1 Tax=Lindgomyces ingoldianus TaxID=673940 RepID=A0ACB6QIK9_9PLEO|nr:sister chromatid cohesion acetyltransferas-like protein Eco1 [Lindgomyces ingoldianus]KAF2466771.1 sister chromatid cohesion acetyltransferas-like protein Eco1 [Lindgomyces ingoldianus]
MSSLTAKKPIKTYSRRRKHSLRDEEPSPKRRRVDAIVEMSEMIEAQGATSLLPGSISSPVRDVSALPTSSPNEPAVFPTLNPNEPAVFSDVPLHSTPPSSPSRKVFSPSPQARRPLFPIFKRQSEPTPPVKEPLSEQSQNIQTPAQPPAQPPAKKKRLVQMQLDLASEVRKACKTCGMEYIPSNAEDATIHRKFHAMSVGGVDFTKAVMEKLRKNQVWAGGDGSFIAVIRRKDTLGFRNKVIEVLKVVNTELAAVAIPDEDLWRQISIAASTNAQAKGCSGQSTATGKGACSTCDRFKTYLYIRGQKCVGACLAERIQEAYTVLDQDDASEPPGHVTAEFHSSSISVSTETEAAILGISRIWTSNLHRKHGIATRLLDSARSDFLYGMTIEKDQVAFSQPTDSGGQLARKWFGRQTGWHVYID